MELPTLKQARQTLYNFTSLVSTNVTFTNLKPLKNSEVYLESKLQ